MKDLPTPPDPIGFLRSLRAVRRYASTPVPDEVLQDILEVGRWTGSGKNSQPWEMVVVRDPNTLRELAGLGPFASHLSGAAFAVAVIMASPNNQLDAGRLAERLMLAAWCRGVGSCIGSISSAENERLAKQRLGVPAERQLRTTIAFGYPADAGAIRVRATPEIAAVLPSAGRKPLSAIAHLETYGAPWQAGGTA
ncbi:MAG: nitroreductase family protein [Chloroflexota bacterium]